MIFGMLLCRVKYLYISILLFKIAVQIYDCWLALFLYDLYPLKKNIWSFYPDFDNFTASSFGPCSWLFSFVYYWFMNYWMSCNHFPYIYERFFCLWIFRIFGELGFATSVYALCSWLFLLKKCSCLLDAAKKFLTPKADESQRPSYFITSCWSTCLSQLNPLHISFGIDQD